MILRSRPGSKRAVLRQRAQIFAHVQIRRAFRSVPASLPSKLVCPACFSDSSQPLLCAFVERQDSGFMVGQVPKDDEDRLMGFGVGILCGCGKMHVQNYCSTRAY